ncbi:MAG TPA: hypothetical protein VNY33_09930 [Gaiellaceae bacterium]|nr:hypothetical protein [Gaiellaceae bacterium]
MEPLNAEQMVRAVSHGLANRVLAIRCYAELASAASLRGDDPVAELESLLDETSELTTLLRDLSPAAGIAARGDDASAFSDLSDRVASRFSDECATMVTASHS